MSNPRNEIWDLCDVLEAELEGRPYDRKIALELAERLASKFPSIHKTMQRIQDRIETEQVAAA
jgi:hypothetical protein